MTKTLRQRELRRRETLFTIRDTLAFLQTQAAGQDCDLLTYLIGMAQIECRERLHEKSAPDDLMDEEEGNG